MAFFLSQASKTNRGLTSFVVLLGKLNSEFVKDFPGITLKSGIQRTITIHHNKPERRLIKQKLFLEVIQVKTRLTTVNRKVHWLERLKVDSELLLTSSVLLHDPAAENDKPIIRSSVVVFEAFPRRALGLDHSLPIVLVFDVAGLADLLSEESADI